MFKCRVSGVRKKKKIERKKKVLRKDFWVEILLSSCFTGLGFFLKKKKICRDFYLLGSYPLVGRHVVKHG